MGAGARGSPGTQWYRTGILWLLVVVAYVLLALLMSIAAVIVDPDDSLADLRVKVVSRGIIGIACEAVVFLAWGMGCVLAVLASTASARLRLSELPATSATMAWFVPQWIAAWLMLFGVLCSVPQLSMGMLAREYWPRMSLYCGILYVTGLAIGLLFFGYRWAEGTWWSKTRSRHCVFTLGYALGCIFLYCTMWQVGGRAAIRLLNLPFWRSLTFWLHPSYWDLFIVERMWWWVDHIMP